MYVLFRAASHGIVVSISLHLPAIGFSHAIHKYGMSPFVGIGLRIASVGHG